MEKLISELEEKIRNLKENKYEIYKELNKVIPNTLSKFGGHEFKISDLDTILSICSIIEPESEYLEEKSIIEQEEYQKYKEYEEYAIYEEYDDYEEDNSIDKTDIETYKKVKFNYNENQKLINIVNYEIQRLNNYNRTTREERNNVINLVRNNYEYKCLSNKNKLSSCVTNILKKNNIIYSFNLENTVYEIFMYSCNNKFNLVYDLLIGLQNDLNLTINFFKGNTKKNNVKEENTEEDNVKEENTEEDNVKEKNIEEEKLYSSKYMEKLEEILCVVDKMVHYEYFKENSSLKYELLDYIDLRTDSEINFKYKSKDKHKEKRKYNGKFRSSNKENSKREALKLKQKGLKNKDIAIRLGKSPQYISELLSGKK